MVNALDSSQIEIEKSFREFCEKLARALESGNSLLPSKLTKRVGGSAVFPGQNVQDLLGREFDRRVSGEYLAYVEARRKDCPELAMKYHKALEQGEITWKSV